MKTFKQFMDEMSVGGGEAISTDVPANNIAHSGASSIDKYDPILGLKMYRRKKKKKENK